MSKREPYPLQWPDGWKRSKHPQRSKFKVKSFALCRDQLIREIELLGGRHIVLTTNLPLRLDGLPYANGREPSDNGVAAYWVQGGREQVMACDRWNRYRDNMHAIELSVAALRGLGRWGSTSIVKRAFAGFAALPPAGSDWRSVLGMPGDVIIEQVKLRYRDLAARAHPDHGGNPDEMQRLNQAYEAAKRELL